MTEPCGRLDETPLHEDWEPSTTTDCFLCERRAIIQLKGVACNAVVLNIDAKTFMRHSIKCRLEVQKDGIDLATLLEDEGPVMNS